MHDIVENRQKTRNRLIRGLDPALTSEQMKILVEDFIQLDPSRHSGSFDPIGTITLNYKFPTSWRQHYKDRRRLKSFLRMRGFELV
jgi:hypothetical protein